MKQVFLKKIDIKDFYFYNKPRYYNSEDYNKVLDKIRSKYFSNNVRAIYRIGSISASGISDIDIIIVLKDKTKCFKRVVLNKKERYLVCHPFYIVDEDIIKNVRSIYPDFDLKLVKGSKIEINKVNKDAIEYVSVFLSIDVAIRHFPRDYLEMLLHKRIDIRDILLRLNALTHSLLLYKKLTDKITLDFENYIKKVGLLRKDWFKLEEEDRNLRLVNLLGESVIISLKFVEKLRNFIIKRGIVKINYCDKNIVYAGMQNRTFFVNNWELKKATKATVKFYKAYGKFYSYLPIEFAALVIEYSKNKGILGRHIKKNLEINRIEYEIKGKAVINQRAFLMNRQAEIALNTKHSHFVAFFDYSFKSKYGFLNKFMYIGRRIKDSKIYKSITTYKGL